MINRQDEILFYAISLRGPKHFNLKTLQHLNPLKA